MAVNELDESLATIAKHALALRSAGVTSVSVGPVKFDIDRIDPPQTITTTAGQDNATASDLDPLDDPRTYGGSIPRRKGSQRELGDDDDDGERG